VVSDPVADVRSAHVSFACSEQVIKVQTHSLGAREARQSDAGANGGLLDVAADPQ